MWTFLVQNSNRIVSGSVLRAVKPEKVRGSYYSCGKYDFAFAHRNELHPDAASIECLGFLTSISFASTTSVERIDFRGSPVCCGVRRSTDFRESRSDNCVCVKKSTILRDLSNICDAKSDGHRECRPNIVRSERLAPPS